MKTRLIYNPNAGKKRRTFSLSKISLEDIEELLNQYQIPFDLVLTKGPGDGVRLAKEAVEEKYELVIAAGGDGTVSEVANGLVESKTSLAILPLGSFMNISRMLSIPFDLEKAVAIIKIGRVRTIDVGLIKKLDGKNLEERVCFLEESGIGLEAQIMFNLTNIYEKGRYSDLPKFFKTLFDYYGHKVKIILDGKEIETRATMVNVSNGPMTSAALTLAPNAKLNDHRLSVNLFRMTKWEITKYLFNMMLRDKIYHPKITSYKAKTIEIISKVPRLVHADARIFGETPVEYRVLPNALSVISGFPKDGKQALVRKNYLDP